VRNRRVRALPRRRYTVAPPETVVSDTFGGDEYVKGGRNEREGRKEPGALERVAALARAWLRQRLA
jgi:hypothetical protein